MRARENWPQSRLRLVTNGFFLHRHPELPVVLSQAGDAFLNVSLHHESAEYLEQMQPILGLANTWQREHKITVKFTPSHTNWTRRYHGFGASMAPYEDRQPRESWLHCPARRCTQLFEGKSGNVPRWHIWACSTQSTVF